MRILPCGETALLVECDSAAEVAPLHALLATAALPVTELVPAERTVLVRLADPAQRESVASRLAVLLTQPLPLPPAAAPDHTLTVEVHYDGDDLAGVGSLTGLTPEAVVAAHTGRPWRVAFSGFAPGFAYLTSTPWRFDVPRRTTPRVRVPAGSVALAAEFSGVYPRESPGGWQLIGRTQLEVFDVARRPAALLRPGVRVRFRSVLP